MRALGKPLYSLRILYNSAVAIFDEAIEFEWPLHVLETISECGEESCANDVEF